MKLELHICSRRGILDDDRALARVRIVGLRVSINVTEVACEALPPEETNEEVTAVDAQIVVVVRVRGLQVHDRAHVLVHVACVEEDVREEIVADHYALLKRLVNRNSAVLHRIILDHNILVTVVAAVWHAKRNLHQIRHILHVVLLERVLRVGVEERLRCGVKAITRVVAECEVTLAADRVAIEGLRLDHASEEAIASFK